MTPVDKSAHQQRKSEPELTPAAQELLDAYVSQVRRRILDMTVHMRRSGGTQPVRMGRVREVLDELESSSKNVGKIRQWFGMHRVDSLRSIWVDIAAIAMAVTTISLLAATSRIPPPVAGALIGVFVGAGSAVLGPLFRLKSERREFIATHTRQAFLDDMSQLEFKARQVGSKFLSSDPEVTSLGRVLAALEQGGIWKQENLRDFKTLLGMRNRLVHESASAPSADTLIEASGTARRLLESLYDRDRDLSTASVVLFEGAIDYEYSVGAALRQMLGEDRVARAADSGIDYIVEMPMGTTLVETKYVEGKLLELREVRELADRIRDRARPGLLIVTNAELSQDVQDFNGAAGDQLRPVEVVTWNSYTNNDLLLRAIARLARQPESSDSTPRYRFQLYIDPIGKYRFRVLAPNGSVIAVSEAYNSRSDAMRQADNLRYAANTSKLDDRTGV